MFLETTTIVLTAFIATATTDEVWNGFVASWSLDPGRFYDLPKTLKAAKNEGWTYISGVDPPKGVTPLGFKDDPTFVLLFENCKVIGFQIAAPVEDYDYPGQPVHWAQVDAIIKKKLNGKSFYTATAYFRNDESRGIRRLWYQEKNGLVEIPTNVSMVPRKTPFLRKNCIPTMGIHFYQWAANMACATLNPWMILGLKDNVIGIGIQGLGTLKTIGKRAWWDTIARDTIYRVMSDPPPCAVNGSLEFGVISLHVWFVDKPREITCD